MLLLLLFNRAFILIWLWVVVVRLPIHENQLEQQPVANRTSIFFIRSFLSVNVKYLSVVYLFLSVFFFCQMKFSLRFLSIANRCYQNIAHFKRMPWKCRMLQNKDLNNLMFWTMKNCHFIKYSPSFFSFLKIESQMNPDPGRPLTVFMHF